MLKAIENWASQSDERARLLVVLLCVGFGMLVVASTLITAMVITHRDPWSS